ncbi:helix-turn-helix domain-containing protein [Calidithermus terrae]|nr:helix-turn-helix transcriptional regulator [Calidithermus terrae]
MTDRVRKAVKERMAQLGMSQGDLAEKLHMERVNLNRVLTGRSGKIPESWQRILDSLGLELMVVPKSDQSAT